MSDLSTWLEKRYWPYVRKTQDCWIWEGRTASLGHGLVSFRGVRYAAHTVAVCLNDPKVENFSRAYGLIINRTCRNKLCVNPDHLSLIERTNFDFSKSVEIRRKLHPGLYKMTEEKALEAIELKASGLLQKHVARMLEVSPSTISQVLTGKEWNTPAVQAKLALYKDKLDLLAREVRAEARKKPPSPKPQQNPAPDSSLPRSKNEY